MMNPSNKNDMNPPAITKMRHNNVINTTMTAADGKTYSKGRKNRQALGGPGRGAGSEPNRSLGGLCGRGTSQGGGGMGPIREDPAFAYAPVNVGVDKMDVNDKMGNVPFNNTSTITKANNTTKNVVTPDKMEIDLESTLQQAVAFSLVAIAAFVVGVLETEQSCAAT
jgi:hypothetical protein